MAIYSRQDLADYALRALGAPVIEINIADEQIDDRIDEALQLFWMYHGEGSTREFLEYTITQQDINRKYIVLPDDITSVSNLLPFESVSSTINLQYQSYMTDLIGIAVRGYQGEGGGLGSLLNVESYLNTLNFFFNHEKRIRFNEHTHILHVDCDWTKLLVGTKLIAECYKLVNPDDYVDVYSDYWFKKFVIALFKRQWGENIGKFDGFQLPSGITLNGGKIQEDAKEEIEKLTEELMNNYQLPAYGFLA